MRIAYSDLEQAESRTVGAILYRLFGDDTYLAVQESGDPHTLVCAMCWRDLPWPEDFTLSNLLSSSERKFPPDLLAAAKKVANQVAYRQMTFRDLAKRGSHGSNYMGQPNEMARAMHTEKRVVQHFQNEYFGAFPFIPHWHDWVREQLQVRRYLVTFLGRRRFFFDRPDSSLKEAVAFEPQSVATGDYMNMGLYLFWKKNLPVHINKQIHDAVAYSFDERDEDWLVEEAQRTLSWTFILTPHAQRLEDLQKARFLSSFDRGCLTRLQSLRPRPFSIPVETKVGWNLGYYNKETNPNGLIKFDPSSPDLRTRQKSTPPKLADLIFSPSGLLR